MTIATSYGTTLFCDDIRDEVANKKSFIGCYTDSIVVQGEFPTVLPTFGICITFIENPSEAIGPLSIRVFFSPQDGPDLALVDADLPEDRLVQSGIDTSDPEMRLSTYLALKASPLRFDAPGRLKVRAYRGDEEFRLGSIAVLAARSDAEPSLVPVVAKVEKI
jgi:hypothetical protein